MIYCHEVGLINALGNNKAEVIKNLSNNQTGLIEDDSWLLGKQKTFLGKIDGALPAIPETYPQHNSRNNQLLLATLLQIKNSLDYFIKKYGKDRIAVIIGTSTSGIHEGEKAIDYLAQKGKLPSEYDYQQQQLGDPSLFLAQYLDLSGPAYSISTACSSSARAIISGANLIKSGAVDVALVGAADSLCKMAINGFHSLEALSSNLCAPFSKHRDGINIGEAAGLMILSKEVSDIALLGYAGSSDAWHMSAPHPEGNGAEKSMRLALERANLQPQDIGYINLHGTATKLNDLAESKAISRIFNQSVPCSSTKHLTGHTLAAAGITEAILSIFILQNNLPLPHQSFSSDNEKDDDLANFNLVTSPVPLESPVILSNSFAFGGNNASLIFGKLSV